MHYVIIIGVAIALGGWMFYPLLTSSRTDSQSSNPNKKSSRKHKKRPPHSRSSESPAHSPLSQHATKNSWQIEDVDVVKELERIRRITDIDAGIEREITRIRKLPEFRGQQRSEALNTIQIVFCPQCGTRLESATLWCKHCEIDVDRYVKENA